MKSSDTSVSMQKWGIPENETACSEFTLLERLVWVPYKDHWWPALLYTSYSELQAHLYDELDMALKAQFAVAIMRQINDPNPIKVARLLGREILEVVEVDDRQYAEFYWQLPKVLPMACKKSRYGGDTQLYIDFHRALDQVEEIIRDLSQNSFNLVPIEEKKTWVQRAEDAMNVPETSSSTFFKQRQKNESIQESDNTMQRRKEADDEEEMNFLFSAIDGVMEKLNSTYDCVSGETSTKIVEPEGEKPKSIPAMNVHTYTSPMSQQKQTRDNLRRQIAKQRMLRQTSSAGSTDCVAVDEAHDEPRDECGEIKKTSSTEVLPGFDADDIVPGITETGMWNHFSPETEEEQAEYPTHLPLDPSRSKIGVSNYQSHSAHGYGSEYMDVVPQKSANAVRRRDYVEPSIPHYQSMESREDDYGHDEEAIKAAKRAAAALELETSFWQTMTCQADRKSVV